MKKTRCHVCSEAISLEKIDPFGTYDDPKEMRAVLISMKWEGDDTPIHEELKTQKKSEGSAIDRTKGRDGLRRTLLSIIEEESSREVVIQRAISLGFRPEDIEDVLEELMANGMILTPRYGSLKRT